VAFLEATPPTNAIPTAGYSKRAEGRLLVVSPEVDAYQRRTDVPLHSDPMTLMSDHLVRRCKVLAVLIVAGTAFALAQEKSIRLIGHGVEPCTAWVEARKDGYSGGYGDWLLGYVSGVNLWGPTGGRDLLRGRSGQELIEWVDRYCRLFPEQDIQSAARELVLDLGRRAKAAETPAN